ncbi:hypothetical protein A0J57_16720 [Sphingobium sp. 22B]|uniref:hypothetical protein n=1 Tax=unclassified Sphingobium TaxID=2611147 RepID=UPI0007812566|nr:MULTISPECIES: hypothetical protein [unclassified Sphingobium]KXU29178.1 hypothetical protein AXW74_24410 [Sphingobium sp. AM]KYC31395.1 hypothetical protein A0J57_16720 [Sphingobium sp. 22B]OAP31277.1 hypothetical protein A8O16_14625 [Sphingobium sp. 20006FA]PNP94761.1 hypothetical protein A8G00_24010 [Sphingobium sp. SA916]
MKTLLIGFLFFAVAFDTPPVLVRPEIAIQKIAACGFKKVDLKFDDTLQEDVIDVLDDASISDEQLRCAALASLASNYYVTFPAPIEKAYQPLYWNLSREQAKADAKAWLDKKGLLSRLPTYDQKQSNSSAFARSLEKLCGPKASGTLKPLNGMSTFNDSALATGALDEETLWCLTNAAMASGYPLGFIGNEAPPGSPHR